MGTNTRNKVLLAVAAALGCAAGMAQSLTYDLTTDGSSVLVDGAYLFQVTTTTATGTGIFNTFLRQQDVNGGSDPSGATQAAGFNSESLQNPMKLELDQSQTFFLRGDASSGSTKILATSTVNNVAGSFFSFGLDINEPNSSIQDYLSIDELELWVSSSPINNPTGYTSLTGSGATKIYELDTTTRDVTVLGRAVPSSSGSGKADYSFLVPQSKFTSVSGWNGTWYVYLWSMVGGVGTLGGLDYGENSGFEEWGTVSGATYNVPPPVPEAGTWAAAGFGLALVGQGWLRRRQRA